MGLVKSMGLDAFVKLAQIVKQFYGVRAALQQCVNYVFVGFAVRFHCLTCIS